MNFSFYSMNYRDKTASMQGQFCWFLAFFDADGLMLGLGRTYFEYFRVIIFWLHQENVGIFLPFTWIFYNIALLYLVASGAVLCLINVLREAVKKKNFRRKGHCQFLGGGRWTWVSFSQNVFLRGLLRSKTGNIGVLLIALTFGTVYHFKSTNNFFTPLTLLRSSCCPVKTYLEA